MTDFEDKVNLNGGVAFSILPDIYVDTLRSTTPSVANVTVFKGSGSVVSITNFTKGVDGQTIRILGDGTTTIVHDATKICTNTGANKVLAVRKIYTFTLIDNIWYEDE